jgi:hypothetical protein
MELPGNLNISVFCPLLADYLRAHNETITAEEHERTFQIVKPFIRTGRVLDWGCFAALDAWRVRQAFGKEVELHGCDVHPPLFSDFWNQFQMCYQTLKHPWHLPYEDNRFDTVIGSGTLEHVPMKATVSPNYGEY